MAATVNGEELKVVATNSRASHFSSPSIGTAFFRCLENGTLEVQDRNDELLKAIFHAKMTDRRAEVNFIPPDPAKAHMDPLAVLVAEESLERAKRFERFLSPHFVSKNAGPMFPMSWAVSVESKLVPDAGSCRDPVLHPRPDYMDATPVIDHILTSQTPMFEKSTEDGTIFRIYSLGSLEVRTTQEHDGTETIGMIFSIRLRMSGCKKESAPDDEPLLKITEYVTRGLEMHHSPHEAPSASRALLYSRSYVVLETKDGSSIMTEQLSDGTVTWDDNPADLEDLNSIAKVVRSAEAGLNVTVAYMKAQCHSNEIHNAGIGVSRSKRKRYAQDAFNQALHGLSASPTSQ